jgi:PKHD-type hydroxylase
MAYSSYFYHTKLPKSITDDIINTCENFEATLEPSTLNHTNELDKSFRSSNHKWISCESWISSFIWYYITKVNDHNFMYDIIDFDEDLLQYTIYNKNDFYHWHTDADLETKTVSCIETAYSSKHFVPLKHQVQQSNLVRKLSFSLLLSDKDDFTGGDLQFHNHQNSWTMDQHLGSLIIFDSTLPHRVTKLKSGTRKSLVGWVLGPRWK